MPFDAGRDVRKQYAARVLASYITSMITFADATAAALALVLLFSLPGSLDDWMCESYALLVFGVAFFISTAPLS